MTTNLQRYFPMIRSRKEVIQDIHQSADLLEIFESWNEEHQNEFLDFCTGIKGVKILYDSFFKEIFNPETTPERLEELLSLILKQKVKILSILPNDSTRIANESSLLIMDIVVELSDGSIANIEVQRLGYAFPGARCACYSADLLLRQYKTIKGKKKRHFSYRDIKKVYTIIFFEKSSKEFQAFPNNYIHHCQQKSDTGIKIDLLQEFFFIPLDIFHNYQHNKGINNKLEAWLTFLSTDSPETIIQLIDIYPEFKELYEDVYTLCLNMERVMSMFSKELLELDKNTVQYMIDEMQDTIDAQKEALNQQATLLEQQQQENAAQKNALEQQKQEIETLKKKLAELN